MTLKRALARRIARATRRKNIEILTGWLAPGSSALVVCATAHSGNARTVWDHMLAYDTHALVESATAAGVRVTVLNQAAPNEPDLDVPTVQGDSARLPFASEAFDYVVMIGCADHVDADLRMRAENERVARCGWAQFDVALQQPIEVHDSGRRVNLT